MLQEWLHEIIDLDDGYTSSGQTQLSPYIQIKILSKSTWVMEFNAISTVLLRQANIWSTGKKYLRSSKTTNETIRSIENISPPKNQMFFFELTENQSTVNYSVQILLNTN